MKSHIAAVILVLLAGVCVVLGLLGWVKGVDPVQLALVGLGCLVVALLITST